MSQGIFDGGTKNSWRITRIWRKVRRPVRVITEVGSFTAAVITLAALAAALLRLL